MIIPHITRDIEHIVTATGAGTWTCPKQVTRLEVSLYGSGGGGGSSSAWHAGGGGGGGLIIMEFDVVPDTTYSYSIGSGGTYNSSGDGGAGGGSSFTHPVFTITANGGGGGLRGVQTNGAAGTCGVSGSSSLANVHTLGYYQQNTFSSSGSNYNTHNGGVGGGEGNGGNANESAGGGGGGGYASGNGNYGGAGGLILRYKLAHGETDNAPA